MNFPYRTDQYIEFISILVMEKCGLNNLQKMWPIISVKYAYLKIINQFFHSFTNSDRISLFQNALVLHHNIGNHDGLWFLDH